MRPAFHDEHGGHDLDGVTAHSVWEIEPVDQPVPGVLEQLCDPDDIVLQAAMLQGGVAFQPLGTEIHVLVIREQMDDRLLQSRGRVWVEPSFDMAGELLPVRQEDARGAARPVKAGP